MNWFTDLWYVWVAMAATSSAVWYYLRNKKRNEVQAQFVGMAGCAAVIYFMFQIASIIMAITSVLSLILKFVIWRHS